MPSKKRQHREDLPLERLSPDDKNILEFFEGVDAYNAAVGSDFIDNLSMMFLERCPYPKSDDKRTAWIAGWLETRAEEKFGHTLEKCNGT